MMKYIVIALIAMTAMVSITAGFDEKIGTFRVQIKEDVGATKFNLTNESVKSTEQLDSSIVKSTVFQVKNNETSIRMGMVVADSYQKFSATAKQDDISPLRDALLEKSKLPEGFTNTKGGSEVASRTVNGHFATIGVVTGVYKGEPREFVLTIFKLNAKTMVTVAMMIDRGSRQNAFDVLNSLKIS